MLGTSLYVLDLLEGTESRSFCLVFYITQQESQKVGEDMCSYPRVEDTQCIDIGVRQMDAIPEVNHFQ